MKTCSTCKEAKPTTEFHKDRKSSDGLHSECKQCRAAYAKKYREDNVEKLFADKKKYYEENPETLVARNKKYREENREKEAARNKKYREENPEKMRAKDQRRRALKSALPATFTPKQWKQALAYFDHKCAYCGKPLSKAHQEHFIPLSKGGGYTKRNIVPSCPKCNLSKHNHNPLDWLVMKSKGLVVYVKVMKYLDEA